jgi:hypothetical protein
MYVHDPNKGTRRREPAANSSQLLSDSQVLHSERRQDSRFTAGDAALLRRVGPLGEGGDPITIVDVSRNGLKIGTRRFIEAGTVIEIELKEVLVVGEVQHSEQFGDSFRAGVLVREVSGFLTDPTSTQMERGA